MYGEGYDWTPLYSVRSGEMVGALPVGIETKGNNDTPYWPTQICWTYKEVWTQPVGEWIWLMQDLNGSAVVSGLTDKDNHNPVEFRNPHTGLTKAVTPVDGIFRLLLARGNYAVKQGATHTTLTAVSGGSYRMDLRYNKAIDFKVTTEAEDHDHLTVRVSASGNGEHQFSIRAENLEFAEADKRTVDLSRGDGEAVWHARIKSGDTPWVAVVIPDNEIDRRKEISGTNTGSAELRSNSESR
jgi:hypothetical protein